MGAAGGSPRPGAPLHQQDPTGRFASRAADYAAARPSYPPAAIDLLLEGLGPPARLVALDLGAGTGISARLLAERGARVLAVEPNAAMRAAAAPHPRVTFSAGTAEATGLATACVRLVVCAQAFHWFDHARALPEIRRVLVPGGRLAVMWNERDREQDPVTAEYSRLMALASEGHPADSAYVDPTATLLAGAFRDPALSLTPNAQALDLEGLKRRALSASYVPKEGPRTQALLAGLAALHARAADDRGAVTLRYATHVVRATAP